MFLILYRNLRFGLPIHPLLLLILLQSEAVVRRCSTKKVFLQISHISQEKLALRLVLNKVEDPQNLTLLKKRFRHRCFFYEFCKISYKNFYKKTFGRLLCINTRSAYFPSTILCLFKNDVTHIFRLSIFSA